MSTLVHVLHIFNDENVFDEAVPYGTVIVKCRVVENITVLEFTGIRPYSYCKLYRCNYCLGSVGM